MVAFFKLTSKESGDLTAFFELDVQGDTELDYLNSFKESSYVKQISQNEFEWLKIQDREKCYTFDMRV